METEHFSESQLRYLFGTRKNRVEHFASRLPFYNLQMVRVAEHGSKKFGILDGEGKPVPDGMYLSGPDMYEWFWNRANTEGLNIKILNEPEFHQKLNHDRELFFYLCDLPMISENYPGDFHPDYLVTSFGCIINLNGMRRPKYFDPKPNKILGYYMDAIPSYGEKVRKDPTIYFHYLTAMAFCPNFLQKNDVHHIDREKLNNFYVNLLWVTKPQHRELHGLWDRGDFANYWRRIREIYEENCGGRICHYGLLQSPDDKSLFMTAERYRKEYQEKTPVEA